MVKKKNQGNGYSFRKRQETIEEEPKIINPGIEYVLPEDKILEEKAKLNSKYIQNWEGYKEYIFFEASSIRKIGDTYYIINLNLKNNFV